MKKLTLLFTLLLTLALTACSDNSDQLKMLQQAVVIENGDECHLCGMLITHFDGPKGELFRKEQGDKVMKFCSTRDMFSYYLDPEKHP